MGYVVLKKSITHDGLSHKIIKTIESLSIKNFPIKNIYHVFLSGLLYITRKIAYKMGLLSILEWNVGTHSLCVPAVWSGALF